MKNFTLMIIMSIFMIDTSLASSDQKVSLEEIQKYSSLVGGYAMKQHCKVVSKHREGDFDLSLQTIRIYLKSKGMSPEAINKLTEDSKKVAKTPPFSSCNDKTKTIIGNTFFAAFDWAVKIANQSKNKD
jgi:hypothetical protein